MRGLAFLALLGFCVGCGSQEVEATPGSKNLIGYSTITPAATELPPEPPTGAPDPAIPTPTPFSYTVQPGDTLSGIAERFRVSLDELRAANPDVSPSAMSIGTLLRIPSTSGLRAEAATPTPAPVRVQQVNCHPTADGGLWCFVLLRNDGSEVLENLAAQVTLEDSTGQQVAGLGAYLPLNVLPVGSALPLSTYFSPGVPEHVLPRAQILSAIPIASSDDRYLNAHVRSALVQVDWAGKTAEVRGEVYLEDGSSPATLIWIAATAFDAAGTVVGLRRWESDGDLLPDSAMPFHFAVSSLAGEIDHVDLAVEARP